MPEIADRMAKVRADSGLTQHEMADKLGIPYRTLQDGERGIAQPGAGTLAAYGEFGVDLNWLVLGRPAPADVEVSDDDITPPAESVEQQNDQDQSDVDAFSLAIARSITDGIGSRIDGEALVTAIGMLAQSDQTTAGTKSRLIRMVREWESDSG